MMSLKKIANLAKTFEIKLAQNHSMDPMDFEGAKKDLGAITDVKEYNQNKTKVSPPAHPTPNTHTGKPNALSNDLPVDIKHMLDVGAPGLKGMLKLKLNGSYVDVMYNADRWHHGASALKRVLTNALSPKYLVSDPVGYRNPEWTFNY